MTRSALFFAAFVLPICFTACQSNTPPPAVPATDAPAPPETQAGAAFRFSKAPMPAADENANWCEAHFDAPLVINAEKEHPNRRYFYLPGGITKVATGPTGAFGTFMLRPVGNGDVEVFTSATLGYCLSNGQNFSPATGGQTLYYNNHHNVQFTMQLREDSGHPLITIEVPPANNYVLMANRCRDCRDTGN